LSTPEQKPYYTRKILILTCQSSLEDVTNEDLESVMGSTPCDIYNFAPETDSSVIEDASMFILSSDDLKSYMKHIRDYITTEDGFSYHKVS
jgi:hypothetical protein